MYLFIFLFFSSLGIIETGEVAEGTHCFNLSRWQQACVPLSAGYLYFIFHISWSCQIAANLFLNIWYCNNMHELVFFCQIKCLPPLFPTGKPNIYFVCANSNKFWLNFSPLLTILENASNIEFSLSGRFLKNICEGFWQMVTNERSKDFDQMWFSTRMMMMSLKNPWFDPAEESLSVDLFGCQ